MGMACPGEDQLIEYLDGKLSPSRIEELEHHLTGCETCLKVVALELRDTVGTLQTEPEILPSRNLGVAIGNGAKVGRYVLLERLGQGGMGIVYSAYDPKLDRAVALKLVRPDTLGSEGQARIMREAQAMARLSHPNVVAIHDVGTHCEQVFIAMDLVKGTTLREWWHKNQPDWNEIHRVLLEAGHGLAAAHSAGIVHRDFKPDNVLIDEANRPLITDFGLARAVAHPSLKITLPTGVSKTQEAMPLEARLTQTGTLMGSPAYMSPEQHRGEPADERSDLFSYCVTFYEVLYGERPFLGDSMEKLRDQTGRGEIRAPPKGSKVPVAVYEALRKGMSPSPQHRQPSMEALLQELGKGPTRARSLRTAIALVSATVLTCFGLGLKVFGAQPCQGAELKLIGVWDASRQQALKEAFLATGLPYAGFVYKQVEQRLLAYSHDWVTMHTEACQATVRKEQSEEALDLRMSCLAQRLQELRASVSLLSKADKQVVERAVQVTEGLSPLQTCADVEALRAPLRSPSDPSAKERIEGVRGRIAQAKALEMAGQFSDGLPHAQAAVDMAQTLDYEPLLAEALAQLGSLQMAIRKDEPAELNLQKAFLGAVACRHDLVAIRTSIALVTHVGENLSHHSEGHLWANIANSNLERNKSGPLDQFRLALAVGGLLQSEGRYDEALTELRNAPVPQGSPLDLAHEHQALGNVLRYKGKYDDALQEQRLALAIYQEVLGPDHPEVARVHGSIGTLLNDKAQYEQSISEHQLALQIQERVFGIDGLPLARIHNNIGNVYVNEGKYEDAIGEYRRALFIQQKSLGSTHPQVAAVHHNLGNVLGDMGKYEEALSEYRMALDIREKTLGPDHPDVGDSHNSLGALLYEHDQDDEALKHYLKALAIREKALGPNHHLVATTCNNIGGVLDDLGRYEEAQAQYKRALKIEIEAKGPEHPDVADKYYNLGMSLAKNGLIADAIAELQRALDIRLKALGPNHPDVADSYAGIASCLETENKYQEALTKNRQAVDIYQKAFGPDHPKTADAYRKIGGDQVAMHEYMAAIINLNRALPTLETKMPDTFKLAAARFSLAKALWGTKQDRPRSRLLAQQARDRYAKGPGSEKDLREVEAWLSAHPG